MVAQRQQLAPAGAAAGCCWLGPPTVMCVCWTLNQARCWRTGLRSGSHGNAHGEHLEGVLLVVLLVVLLG